MNETLKLQPRQPAAPLPLVEREILRASRVDSTTLMRGARELVIDHAGREYRLRITQNGKLILTA